MNLELDESLDTDKIEVHPTNMLTITVNHLQKSLNQNLQDQIVSISEKLGFALGGNKSLKSQDLNRNKFKSIVVAIFQERRSGQDHT